MDKLLRDTTEDSESNSKGEEEVRRLMG